MSEPLDIITQRAVVYLMNEDRSLSVRVYSSNLIELIRIQKVFGGGVYRHMARKLIRYYSWSISSKKALHVLYKALVREYGEDSEIFEGGLGRLKAFVLSLPSSPLESEACGDNTDTTTTSSESETTPADPSTDTI